MEIERILVGVDGSEGAHAAVTWAAVLARATGAEVVAVHAVGMLERLGGATVPSRSHLDEVRALLEGPWCAPLADAGVRWRAVLRDGNAVQVALAAAAEEGADLIVVGSRRLGGSSPLLLGSTSTQIAQEARCPVTVVPPGWGAAGAEAEAVGG